MPYDAFATDWREVDAPAGLTRIASAAVTSDPKKIWSERWGQTINYTNLSGLRLVLDRDESKSMI